MSRIEKIMAAIFASARRMKITITEEQAIEIAAKVDEECGKLDNNTMIILDQYVAASNQILPGESLIFNEKGVVEFVGTPIIRPRRGGFGNGPVGEA